MDKLLTTLRPIVIYFLRLYSSVCSHIAVPKLRTQWLQLSYFETSDSVQVSKVYLCDVYALSSIQEFPDFILRFTWNDPCFWLVVDPISRVLRNFKLLAVNQSVCRRYWHFWSIILRFIQVVTSNLHVIILTVKVQRQSGLQTCWTTLYSV